ncbi:MAG: hypothetical protein WD601_03735 [Pseudohongiellaceae bacterium]
MSIKQQSRRECLNCGMWVPVPVPGPGDEIPSVRCPKCDDLLFRQTDGSILTADIAHQQETVRQALEKMDSLIAEAVTAYFKSVRLIVGSGLIREEVHGQLHYLLSRGAIISWSQEGRNQGAVLVQIRRG